MKNIIIDGDWGGDEMQLVAVLLAHPDEVNILGATCVFGNTHHDHVFENARNVLRFLQAPSSIKVYPGEKRPKDGIEMPKDGAHGKDGIGNVELEPSVAHRETKHAVKYILDELEQHPDKSITITASGPLTNIAEAIRQRSDIMAKVDRIVIMGGCTHDMAAKDMDIRRGNVTPYAEFNFFQAPADAQTVMQSGLPITLLPMNCTHQLTLTNERQSELSRIYQTNPKVKQALLGVTDERGVNISAFDGKNDTVKGMITAPGAWDLAKFGSSPVMHDVNCALYVLRPEAYVTEQGNVTVLQGDPKKPDARPGHTEYAPNATSNITVATSIKDPEALYQLFKQNLTTRVPPQKLVGVGKA